MQGDAQRTGVTGTVPPVSGFDHPRVERRDAAEHRRHILDTARILFTERGVDAVSMHQIAQVAEVGQGTLYRRYAHKGELCMDLMREGAEQFWSELEAYLAESEESTPALARLDGVLVRLLSLVEENAPLLGAVGDAFCGERRAMQFRNHLYARLHETVSGLLTEAAERGEIASLDATYTADVLLAAFGPDLYLFHRQDRGYSPERILHGLRQIYIDGLKLPRRA